MHSFKRYLKYTVTSQPFSQPILVLIPLEAVTTASFYYVSPDLVWVEGLT